eukprot:jgi/Chrzof1/2052/Cz11g01050.t1
MRLFSAACVESGNKSYKWRWEGSASVRQRSVVWYSSSILQLLCNPTATKPLLHSTITTINGSTVNALLAHT